MHVFTRVIGRLKEQHREAVSQCKAAKFTWHRHGYRNKALGLRIAIEMLERERSRKMDDVVESVRRA